MADILMPPWIVPESDEVRWIDDLTAVFMPQFSRGFEQYNSMGDPRMGVRRRFRGLSSEARGALMALAPSLKGRFNTLLMPVRFPLRGSFPVPERFNNPTFENGTTTWTGSNCTLSVADRVLRLKPSIVAQWSANQVTTAVAYAPYVIRSFLRDGAQTAGLNAGRALYTESGVASSDYTSARGLGTLTGVMSSASSLTQYPVVVNATSGYDTRAFLDVPYVSMQRCALVDGGGNLLLQSQDFTTTWANTRSTDSGNTDAAPDGTTTADRLIEDGTGSATHYIEQTITVGSGVGEYAFSCYVKAGTRSWAFLLLRENTGVTNISAYVNLSNGSIGTTATGANWTGLRTFSESVGNGWYRVTLVARKTNAATGLTAFVYMATGDGVYVYNGDSASYIILWGACLKIDAVPGRYTATTTAAVSAVTQSGNRIELKGLPASTTGLLLPGDVIELDKALCVVAAALNSNESGLGTLLIEPGTWRAVSDREPVVIGEPMGRFKLADDASYQNLLGAYADLDLDLVQVYDA